MSEVINSCDSLTGWEFAEGQPQPGTSAIRLNTTNYTTGPASVELEAGKGAWGVWFLWRAYLQYDPWTPRDLTDKPILEFDVRSDLQDPNTKLTVILIADGDWGDYKYGPFSLNKSFQKISIDLRVPNDPTKFPDLSKIGYIQFVLDSDKAFVANTTTQIDNLTKKSGEPIQLMMNLTPTEATITEGRSVTFTAKASGGVSPYSYEWILNGAVVGTSSTCTVAPGLGTHIITCIVTDSAEASLQKQSTINVKKLLTPPFNPSPWSTKGHKIFDANNKEVLIRSIGLAGDTGDSVSGMWGGKGDDVISYSYKWQPIDATLKQKMYETMKMFNKIWYLNAIRIQGCGIKWWWQDLVNPLQECGQGPDTNMSYRNYWEMFVSTAQSLNMQVVFCPGTIFDYYTTQNVGNNGGFPMNLTDDGASYMATIDPDEMEAWRKWWTSIVQRLGEYPNVMWELWNEPGNVKDEVQKHSYFQYMIEMYKTIRGLGDNHNIIFQMGMGFVPTWAELDWIPEFHKMLRTAIGGEPVNVVYQTHCYRHSPWFNQSWKIDYDGLKAQFLSDTAIPCTRSTDVDVPVFVDETGVLLATDKTYPGNVTPEPPEDRLNNDLTWFNSLIQVCRDLGIGVSPEFYHYPGFWSWDESLVAEAHWPADALSPIPSITMQMFIDNYQEGATPKPFFPLIRKRLYALMPNMFNKIDKLRGRGRYSG